MSLVFKFFYISVLSLLLGILIGGIHAFILKKLRFISHKAHYEIGLTFFIGLISYLIGETCHLSGIICK